MVVYNTTDGSIIRVAQKMKDRATLSTGSGLLTELHLTGVDLDGHAQADVDQVLITSGDVTMRRIPGHWVDDTHVVLRSPARRLDGAVSWELLQFVTAVQFSAQEKADAIAEVKTDEGIDTVDAILVTASQTISTSQWYVDTADGNKLKWLAEQPISPE